VAERYEGLEAAAGAAGCATAAAEGGRGYRHEPAGLDGADSRCWLTGLGLVTVEQLVHRGGAYPGRPGDGAIARSPAPQVADMLAYHGRVGPRLPAAVGDLP
jgi:hypothetical protein